MDFNRILKTVTNLNEYITLTRDLQNDSVYINLKIPFNISTILTLKNIQYIEIEYFNKYEENGAAMKIFELLLHSPPSKTWSLIGKELVCLLHYWLDAIRKHLITHNTQWWLFLKLLLDYIKDIQTKDTSIVNFLIEETAECLLDLATHSIPELMQKYEIIQTFNSISAASSREIRLAYRDTFQNYFVKLSAVLAGAGDARAQEATLAALLRWLLPRQDGAVRRAAADGWLRPAGFSEDAVRVFLERPWNNFVKVSAVLAGAGDARAQEATLAALLRWLLPRQDGAVRRAAADGWLRPAGFSEDAVRVFLERPWNNFVKVSAVLAGAGDARAQEATLAALLRWLLPRQDGAVRRAAADGWLRPAGFSEDAVRVFLERPWNNFVKVSAVLAGAGDARAQEATLAALLRWLLPRQDGAVRRAAADGWLRPAGFSEDAVRVFLERPWNNFVKVSAVLAGAGDARAQEATLAALLRWLLPRQDGAVRRAAADGWLRPAGFSEDAVRVFLERPWNNFLKVPAVLAGAGDARAQEATLAALLRWLLPRQDGAVRRAAADGWLRPAGFSEDAVRVFLERPWNNFVKVSAVLAGAGDARAQEATLAALLRWLLPRQDGAVRRAAADGWLRPAGFSEDAVRVFLERPWNNFVKVSAVLAGAGDARAQEATLAALLRWLLPRQDGAVRRAAADGWLRPAGFSEDAVRVFLERPWNNFVKVSAVLAGAGDARAQEATLAALLRWLLPRQDGAVRRAAADGWLRPAGFSEDAVRVFLERPWNNFLKDARDFLNTHNASGDRVTSVICKKLTIGKRVCIMAGSERAQRWLDVNVATGCVSVTLETPPARRAVRIAEDNVSAVLFSRESGQTLITLVVLDYCRMYEGEEEGGSGGSVHVVVGTGRDAARLDRALRAVFKDKYQCLFDVDNSISVCETSQSMDVIYGTEEDSRFSVSSQVRQKRGKRGFIVRSKNAGSSKCTSAATTSFAQRNQDLPTLPPVTNCELSQTSGISEVSDTQQIQTRSTVELGKRGHCNVKIKKPNYKDSEGISSRQNKPIEIIQKSINVTVDSSHTILRTSSKSQFENNINVLESFVVDNNETDEFYPSEKVRFIHDVQAVEDFFSQHCKDNRNGNLIISPSLARKINETSSESGDELRILSPDYIVQDFNIDGIPDGNVCQETLESDIVCGFEKNIDNVPIELNTQTKEKTSIMNEASAASNKDTDLKKMNENSTSQDNAKTINDVKLKFTRRKSLCQKPPETLRSNKKKTLSPITERESVVEKQIVTKNVENVEMNPVNTDPKPTLRRKRKLYSPNNMPNEKSEVRGIETSQKNTTTTPETRAKVSNRSTCYKELEQERKRTRSPPRKKNFQNIMSPKTLKRNQIFDSLKDASNIEPTNLVEKRSAADNTVYNFTSDSEDEYVNKTDLRKTPNKNEKTVLKKDPNKSEKKSVLKKGPNKDAKARVTRTRTRKQKKEIDNSANEIPKRRQSARNRQKNIAIEVESSERNLVDERIRGEVSDKLNTSLTFPKDLEDISDKDPNPILRRTPQAEYISEDICKPKDDNENIKQRNTKTKRILSLKRNKDTPNPNLELRSADNERTISPLPSLVVESVLNPDSDTSTNAVQAWKDIYLGKRVPETEVNTTHNLLSDNNSLCQSPHNIDITEIRPTLYLSSDQESNLSGKKSPVVLLHRMSSEVIRSLQSNSSRSSDLDDSKMLSNVDLATLNEKLESVITNSRNADSTNKTSEDKRTKTVKKSLVSPIFNLRTVRGRVNSSFNVCEPNNSKMNNTAVNRKIVKNNRRKSVREKLTTESVQRKSETTEQEMEMSKETQTVANSDRTEATCGNSPSPKIDHGDSDEEVPFNPISPNEKTPPREVENECMNQSFKYLLTKYTKEFNVSRTLRSSNKNRRKTIDCNEDNDDQSSKNGCSKSPENRNTLIPCSLTSNVKPNSSGDSENILKDNVDKVMANETNLEGSNVTPKAKSAKAERKSIISPIFPFSKKRLQSENLPSKEQTGSIQKRERCMKPFKNTVISTPVASEASFPFAASKRKTFVECQPSTSRNAKDSRCDGNNNTGTESSRCPSTKSVTDWFERNECANAADASIQNSTNTETPNDVPESSFVGFNKNFVERYQKIIENIQEQRAERERLLKALIEVKRAWDAVTEGLTDNMHCSDEIMEALLQLLNDTHIFVNGRSETSQARQRE